MDEVTGGPRSAVWQQASNREPIEQALLYALVGRSLERLSRADAAEAVARP